MYIFIVREQHKLWFIGINVVLLYDFKNCSRHFSSLSISSTESIIISSGTKVESVLHVICIKKAFKLIRIFFEKFIHNQINRSLCLRFHRYNDPSDNTRNSYNNQLTKLRFGCYAKTRPMITKYFHLLPALLHR